MKQIIKQKTNRLAVVVALLFAVIGAKAQSDSIYISGSYWASGNEQWYGSVKLLADAQLTMPANAKVYAYGANFTAQPGATISGSAAGVGANDTLSFTAPNPMPAGNTTAVQQQLKGGNIGGPNNTVLTTNIFPAIEINNSAGVNLIDSATAVGSSVYFKTGLVTTASASTPLIFGASATAVIPTDSSSYVNGYAQYQGTGAFTYPIGDGSRFEPVGINLTTNDAGLEALYNVGDAGGSTIDQPLKYYNTFEYWDLTPVNGATSAQGAVTIYWDKYNNVGITDYTKLTVAHRISASEWIEEGTAGSNTRSSTSSNSAGSVTTAAPVTSWSPFTLGSETIANPLPVTGLQLTATVSNSDVALNWETAIEINSKNFTVQRSADNGATWTNVGTQPTKAQNGNSSTPLSYTFTDSKVATGNYQYRVVETGLNGNTQASNTVQIQVTNAVKIYPNPANSKLNVTVATSADYQLVNMLGNVVLKGSFNAGNNIISVTGMPSGTYILRVITGNSATSHKVLIN